MTDGNKRQPCPYQRASDETAQAEPLTEGQRIVADYERDPISMPWQLAQAIDTALIEAWERGRETAAEDREYSRDEMREACRINYNAGWHKAVEWLRQRADSHAGRWMTMEPRDALKDAAREMETINVG